MGVPRSRPRTARRRSSSPGRPPPPAGSTLYKPISSSRTQQTDTKPTKPNLIQQSTFTSLGFRYRVTQAKGGGGDAH